MRRLAAAFPLLLLSCYGDHGAGSRAGTPEATLVGHSVDGDMGRFCSPACFTASIREGDGSSDVSMRYSARENRCGQFKLDWTLRADTLSMGFVDTSGTICDTVPAIIFVTHWRFKNLETLRVRITGNNPGIDTLLSL